MGKTLTAYFSASGVTAKAARIIAEETGGDLFEIRPRVPYTKADLDWTDRKSRSSVEMSDRNARPETDGAAADTGRYGTVYLGFPVWWYREPSIIDTFLEQYDFSGKTIVLFATSGSSGFGATAQGVRGLVSPQTTVREGKVFSGRLNEKAVREWIRKTAGK